MKQTFLSLLFFSLTTVFAQESGLIPISTFQQYVEQLEATSRNDKMIFVALFDNKENSKRVKAQNPFQSPSLKASLENYTALEIDITSEMGAQWIQAFPVLELPAFYFLNKNEIILNIETGFQDISALNQLATVSAQNKNLYQTLNTKYGLNQLSPTEWITLLGIHSLNFDFIQTHSLALEFLNSLNEFTLLDPKILPVLVQYGVDLETRYPEIILENQQKIAQKWSGFNFKQWFEITYSFNFDRALFNSDTTLLLKIIDPLISQSSEENKESLAFTTYQIYVEETQNFRLLKKAVMDYTIGIKDSAKRSRFIFDEAFKIADQNDNAQAYKTAGYLAHQASLLSSDFRYKMLEAYSAYQTKNYDEAEKLAQEASSITTNAGSKSKAASLLKVIRSAKEQDEKTE